MKNGSFSCCFVWHCCLPAAPPAAVRPNRPSGSTAVSAPRAATPSPPWTWTGRSGSLTVDQQAQAARAAVGACNEPGPSHAHPPRGVTPRSCQLTGGIALVDFSQAGRAAVRHRPDHRRLLRHPDPVPAARYLRGPHHPVEGQDLAYSKPTACCSPWEVLMTSEDDVTRTPGGAPAILPRLGKRPADAGIWASTFHEGDSA